MDIVLREAENIVQVIGYASKLTVDKVKRRDEIRCRDSHKCLDNSHLCLSASACQNIGIQLIDERAIGFITQLKIRNDSVSFDA